MTDHPRELLPLIAEGLRPTREVTAHIDSCSGCRRALRALSPLDLGAAWESIEAELDAPAPGVVERALTLFGLDEGMARFVALTPSLRFEWLLASVGVLALAVLGMLAGRPNGLSLVLLVAPLVSAGVIAFAYGPISDPAHEIVAATPLSPLLAVLLRSAAVLGVDSVLVYVAVAATGDAERFTWFLPMTFVALLAAGVGLKISPPVGAGVGMGVWSITVFASVALAEDPAAVLWGGAAQVFYAIGSLTLLAAVLLTVAHSRGFVGTRSEARRGI